MKDEGFSTIKDIRWFYEISTIRREKGIEIKIEIEIEIEIETETEIEIEIEITQKI